MKIGEGQDLEYEKGEKEVPENEAGIEGEVPEYEEEKESCSGI